MTTQKVEEAIESLKTSAENYHKADTFDNRLYWLKNLRNKALDLKDAIADTLGE